MVGDLLIKVDILQLEVYLLDIEKIAQSGYFETWF